MTQPSRRDALKALTAATGALSLAALPDEWTTPVINAGALPPHAQVSPCYDLIVTWERLSGSAVSFLSAGGIGGPDESSGPGADGFVRWFCGSITEDCGTVVISPNNGATNRVTFTSRDGSTDFDDFVGDSDPIYFNSSTGAAAFDNSVCPDP